MKQSFQNNVKMGIMWSLLLIILLIIAIFSIDKIKGVYVFKGLEKVLENKPENSITKLLSKDDENINQIDLRINKSMTEGDLESVEDLLRVEIVENIDVSIEGKSAEIDMVVDENKNINIICRLTGNLEIEIPIIQIENDTKPEEITIHRIISRISSTIIYEDFQRRVPNHEKVEKMVSDGGIITLYGKNNKELARYIRKYSPNNIKIYFKGFRK